MLSIKQLIPYPILGIVVVSMCSVGPLLSLDTEAREAKTLLGDWKLNPDETERLKPKRKRKGTHRQGFSVHVMGAPTSRGGSRQSGRSPNMPEVLSCTSLTLSRSVDQIQLSCPDMSGSRKFKIGKHHGRTVRWNNRELSEKYRSTSRRVEHEFQLKKKDRMHVKVSVKPKNARKLEYTLVFDRVSEPLSNTQ